MSATYTNLLFHVVFSTKLRIPLITKPLQSDLHKYIGGIVRERDGSLLEIGGVADHVHLLLKLKPAHALAEIMRVVKTNSSRWVNQTRGGSRKFAWQDGYAAFTVSRSQYARVCAYIRGQEEHHRRTTYTEELIALLKRHGVEYDERYLSD